ncbi:hypothetical protein ABZV67_39405 [Streptomyces sp. NPDC005065]|uniref:hypothetical protein n=1 Tax=Streptomyces sp. NPDC005065 TaxID=3154461 RepID=UPI0033AEBEBC
MRKLELSPDLFAEVSDKQVDAWRAPASKEYPAKLERMKPPMRLTLLAALCHVRHTEITDSLAELFIQLVLKINTRAEKKVDKELADELKKVRGKEAMILRVAEAALAEPSGTVRRVIFPVVSERTLKALAAEAAANEAKYKARVRTVLRSAHWRWMLTPLLNALTLKCNNTAYRPVMDAIDLLQRYLGQPLKEGRSSTCPPNQNLRTRPSLSRRPRRGDRKETKRNMSKTCRRGSGREFRAEVGRVRTGLLLGEGPGADGGA